MRILLDENVPLSLVTLLRGSGHDTRHVITDGRRGAADDEVLAVAAKDSRFLITGDRGLGDARRSESMKPAGIIVFRFREDVEIETRNERIMAFLSTTAESDLSETITIVGPDPGKVRIRPYSAGE